MFIAVIIFVVVVPLSLFVIRYHPSDIGRKAYGEGEMIAADVTGAAGSIKVLGGVAHKVALKSLSFWLLLYFTLASSLFAAFSSSMPGYAVSVGFSPTLAATATSTLLAGGVVGKLALGFLNDKIGPVKAVGIAVILGVLSIVYLLTKGSTSVFFVGAFLFGIALAICSVEPPILVRSCFGQKEYSAIMSNVTTPVFIAGGIGIPLYNFIFDTTSSYVSGMIFAVVFLVTGYMTMIVSLKASKKLTWEE